MNLFSDINYDAWHTEGKFCRFSIVQPILCWNVLSLMEFGYLKIYQLTLLINHGNTRINEFRKQVRFSKILLESWYAAGLGAKIGLSIWKFTKRGRGSSNFRILNIIFLPNSTNYYFAKYINISHFWKHLHDMIHWLQAIILDSVKRSFSKDVFFEKCIHRFFKLTISQNIVNIVTKTSNVTENKSDHFKKIPKHLTNR